MLNPKLIEREDSENSACSSIWDSAELNCMPTGKVISIVDMEFERRKKFFFNAALHHFNPKAFAEAETAEDVRYAVKFCQEKNVRNLCFSQQEKSTNHIPQQTFASKGNKSTPPTSNSPPPP